MSGNLSTGSLESRIENCTVNPADGSLRGNYGLRTSDRIDLGGTIRDYDNRALGQVNYDNMVLDNTRRVTSLDLNCGRFTRSLYR